VELDAIEAAVQAVAAGVPVVVVDDPARENEGDLILAAEKSTVENIAFMVRWTSGFLCAPLTADACARLQLPPMHVRNDDPYRTAYRVTVDASDVPGTGISADDRAFTLRKLASPDAVPEDFRRPGHVIPLQAAAGGVRERAGHTEAAIDLARLAGLQPAGVLAEIPSEWTATEMARLPELTEFARRHHLPIISIADLAAYLAQRPRGGA
jgi:3,4-dihydroxy 2-butanone 4-phosphate synthase/GTP cyclohydrolase II